MKKILFFLFLSNLLFAQNQVIDFKYRLTDPKSNTKSLELIDAREDKSICEYTRKNKTYTFSFPTGNAKSDIENWFDKDNKKRGVKDIVIVLNDIKVYEKKGIDKVDFAKIFISASSYAKIGNEYFLINVIDGTKTINTWEYQNISQKIASSIGMILNKFITESYSLEPSKIAVPQEQLVNYRKYLTENLQAYKTNHFEDGIYKDYKSFFNQNPLKNYTLIKNEKGDVIRAESTNDKLRLDQIFIYVENGIAYKITLGNIFKIDEDEKGFYIFSGITLLSQGLPHYDFTPVGGGAIAGGLGALGNTLTSKEQQKMLEKEEKEKVYISPFTGEYIFEY